MAGDDELAAQVLRGLQSRVSQLEESQEPDGPANIIRIVEDEMNASDSVTVTTDTSPGMVWEQDNWSFSEWQ